ncbi:hypothetical protein LTR95_005484 [Oleoguttula sp. CCFEE 5521]
MAQYTHLPPGLFRPGDKEAALQEFCERLALQLDIQLLHSTEAKRSSGTSSHRCMLKISIGDEKLHVVGEGTASKPTSRDAAWAAMIAQMRESGNHEDLNLKLRTKLQPVASKVRATPPQPPRPDSVSPLDRGLSHSQTSRDITVSARLGMQSLADSPSTPQPAAVQDTEHVDNPDESATLSFSEYSLGLLECLTARSH